MSAFKNLIEVFKLSTTPPTIIYPIPILAFLVFSVSNQNVESLILAIVFSSIFYAGVNLWNHVNDIEEDILAGKRNILIESPRIRKLVAILVVFLYLTSFTIVYFKSNDGLPSFLACSIVTWIYSDKMIFGRFIRRWKEHYITEVLTYVIAIPTFTLTLWSLFDKISLKAIALSISITFLMLFGTFLKDIKDATGDELAGLRTLAVVFSPSKLLKVSVIMLWLYYISILVFIILKIFSFLTILAVGSFLLLLYSTYMYLRNNWKITVRIIKPIKIMISSTILSLILFIVSNLLSQPLLKYQ